MRKKCKENIEKYIDLLPQICEAIKATKQSNPQEAEYLLTECGQGLSLLKKQILESEGEGCKTLELIEKYEATLPQGDNTIWEELRRSVAQDIKAKKEVVFLPYKASMWDSLESVWMAARDDEECDAYVVPIPYYDRDCEHNFTKMHWEGNQYPNYVPITHYTEYDICKRRPDAIFIHNPYDECNHVTSVHPDYYAKVLCNYTDKLVYVPYFVLNEIEPTNQRAIDRMKHFCYLPGTRYADTVVLQSDAMCEIYISEYLKEAEASGEIVFREELETRFRGLGSPKLDKVASTEREAIAIPPEWKKIITKPDGTRKKVILYNNSITAFLQAEKKMLEKIRKVFEVCYKNREEVALLWRPHPLMEQTISMGYPELWAEYEEIVHQYREAGWGIYDDTADLDRAIAISDGYYGDPSSIVQLYQRIGKPVMIQDPKR